MKIKLEISKLEGALEAILFASGESISVDRLSQALEVEAELVDRLVSRLQDKYEQAGSALQILRLADSYQLSTREEYAPFVKKALDIRRNVPLSQAAMEVLSIVAYNEPVTKSFIEQIRGIDSSSVVNSLVEKGWWKKRDGWNFREGPSPIGPLPISCGVLACPAWRNCLGPGLERKGPRTGQWKKQGSKEPMNHRLSE